MTRTLTLLVLVLALMALAACGKKGDIKPPSPTGAQSTAETTQA